MKTPLAQQIEATQRAGKLAKALMPGQVREHFADASELSSHIAQLSDVEATLRWFAAHEQAIRNFWADYQAAKQHPAVVAVTQAFPGATISAVRRAKVA